MNKQELRKLLKVPDEQRIAQHIYNQFRDYEDSIDIMIKDDGKLLERSVRGIDIFNVEDDDFIKEMFK